jgi:hypothetical protein
LTELRGGLIMVYQKYFLLISWSSWEVNSGFFVISAIIYIFVYLFSMCSSVGFCSQPVVNIIWILTGHIHWSLVDSEDLINEDVATVKNILSITLGNEYSWSVITRIYFPWTSTIQEQYLSEFRLYNLFWIWGLKC